MTPECPYCTADAHHRSDSRRVIRIGRFYRKSDSRWVRRFRCLKCKKGFSSATLQPCYRQNKRQKNYPLRQLLCSGLSLRRVAKILNIHRTTVVRKLLFLAAQAEIELEQMNRAELPAEIVEFDDLETIEHTKCKPLSVTMMVSYPERRIIGFEVARMPAKGLLAKIAKEKYGVRKDERPKARKALFERTLPFVAPRGLIKSDQNPYYPNDVRKYFPDAEFKTFRSRRGCVAGQGELKKIGFDPIFRINHTFAMLRANINRLFRRTWCTTKRPDRLRAHIMIYAVFHNKFLIKK